MTRRALKVCAEPRCPELTDSGRCPGCASKRQRQVDQVRGSRQARGYDRTHDRLRARWKPKVDLGHVPCARCGRLILIGQLWSLDHTDDRTGYLGPSHRRCNDSAGGQAAHRKHPAE